MAGELPGHPGGAREAVRRHLVEGRGLVEQVLQGDAAGRVPTGLAHRELDLDRARRAALAVLLHVEQRRPREDAGAVAVVA